MSKVARKQPWYIRWYEHLLMKMVNALPPSREHEGDEPWQVPWEPFTRQRCNYCAWVKMSMDEIAYEWQCSHCRQRYQTDVPVTVKRPAVKPVILPETPPRILSVLPEQRAIQPPQVTHIVMTTRPRERMKTGELGRKFSTGEIVLINGKPHYASGRKVDTNTLPYIPRHRRLG